MILPESKNFQLVRILEYQPLKPKLRNQGPLNRNLRQYRSHIDKIRGNDLESWCDGFDRFLKGKDAFWKGLFWRDLERRWQEGAFGKRLFDRFDKFRIGLWRTFCHRRLISSVNSTDLISFNGLNVVHRAISSKGDRQIVTQSAQFTTLILKVVYLGFYQDGRDN